jgi:hypothetical protein
MLRTRFRLLAWICVLCLLLPTLPAGAAETQNIYQGFVYNFVSPSRYDPTYVEIVDYVGTGKETVEFPAQIGDYPVWRIGKLGDYTKESIATHQAEEVTTLIIPEGVRALCDFQCDFPNVTNVELPNTLKVITNGALDDMPLLADLFVPSSVALIVDPNGDRSRCAPFSAETTLHGEESAYVAAFAAAHNLPFQPVIYTPSPGDVDADGLCTSTDARLILQHTVEKITLAADVAAFADVDGDGEITSTDARLCLQYAVGKTTLTGVSVPATKQAAEGLISPDATVIAGYSPMAAESAGDGSWDLEGTWTLDNGTAVIQGANAIIDQSFYTVSTQIWSIHWFQYSFREPDGSTITIRQLNTGQAEMDISYMGGTITGLSAGTKAWNVLHHAMMKDGYPVEY